MSERIVISDNVYVWVQSWDFLVSIQDSRSEISFSIDRKKVDEILKTGEINYQGNTYYKIFSRARGKWVEIIIEFINSDLFVACFITKEEFEKLLEIFKQYKDN